MPDDTKKPTLYTNMETNNDLAYLSDLSGLLNTLFKKSDGTIDMGAVAKLQWLLEHITATKEETGWTITGVSSDVDVVVNGTATVQKLITTGTMSSAMLPDAK